MENSTLLSIIKERNVMLEKQKYLYIAASEKINSQMKDLLTNDFGSTLMKNAAHDIVDEVVRRFFDFGDCYITADQMYNRIMNFSYSIDNDIPQTDSNIRQLVYNFKDSPLTNKTLKEIQNDCQAAQKQVFTENRNSDGTNSAIKRYRNRHTTSDGKMCDELTGKLEPSDSLQADHVQSRAAASYNSRYIDSEKSINSLRSFFNSDDNLQMINSSANTSKGDIRVENSGADITSTTATSKEIVDKVCSQWEKSTKSESKIKNLQEAEYLDKDGKVTKNVKTNLKKNIVNSQNKESCVILKNANYKNVGLDAAAKTATSFKKIIAGQLIYYILPPVVFETQTLLKRKGMSLDTFFIEIKKSSKRIVNYVSTKLKGIFSNIVQNSLNKFVKTFFDILIEIVKATVKRIFSIIKQLVMALINCARTIVDKHFTPAQKADSVTKLLASCIGGILVDFLFEYLQKIGIPNFLAEVLQIITSALVINLIMLILQKADLFNVQYGLLVSNIKHLFSSENEKFISQTDTLYKEGTLGMEQELYQVKNDISSIKADLQNLSLIENDSTPYLQKLSEVFDMKIDFNQEWKEFCSIY